ncbi:hypothetical protein WJF60_23390, partial [Salmonella enterica subsp. enterica serovar Corvallis]
MNKIARNTLKTVLTTVTTRAPACLQASSVMAKRTVRMALMRQTVRTKRKQGQKQVLHRLLLVSLVPSGVVWAHRCAKMNQTVSIIIMSVMGNQTVEMVQ